MTLQKIQEITARLGLDNDSVEFYGNTKAKVDLSVVQRQPKGKLILVSAVSPTPAGEGKTTVNIGLSMALCQLGHRAISVLREPSLGPNFGMKGGATGGGKSQVLPMEDINLHFTGDIHAITSATNLLAAMIDNHIFHGNSLNIDPRRIAWNRSVDMNDRTLRSIRVNIEDEKGFETPAHFDISVASEVMAVFCLASDLDDLKKRLDRMVVAYTFDGSSVYARDIGCVDAMVVLLKDALRPNIVQTTEHTPAIVHGGPFANIAHGCNSIIATRLGLTLGDYAVTEAGFGSDLGAEKFFNIKCRQGDLSPSATVLVATLRSIKYQAGISVSDLDTPNVESIKQGVANLKRHIEGLQKYGVPCVIAINMFPSDTEEELEALESILEKWGLQYARVNVYSEGGKGGLELAQIVHRVAQEPSSVVYTYNTSESIVMKLRHVVTSVYGAKGIILSPLAQAQLEAIEKNYGSLQVCIAKTQYSFTDRATILGAPDDFEIRIRELKVSNGAGFIVAKVGSVMTMPGLPARPQAERIGIDAEGNVFGIKG